MEIGMLTIGMMVQGSYRYGCVSGIVKSIHKKHVVINQYQQWYGEFINMNKELNLTIKRIDTIVENPIIKGA